MHKNIIGQICGLFKSFFVQVILTKLYHCSWYLWVNILTIACPYFIVNYCVDVCCIALNCTALP